MFDFHTHTFLSDGVLSPVELIRRAHVAGYRVMAITDHVGHGNLEFILKTLIKDCEVASKNWDILALPWSRDHPHAQGRNRLPRPRCQ